MQEDFEKKTSSFLEWLQKTGTHMSPKMSLTDLRGEGRGRGVIASGLFDEDEVIFSIPRSSTLNVKNVLEEFCKDNPPAIPKILDSLPEWAALATIMVSESQRTNSRWSPYLDILPQHMDSLIFWSDAELAELQASAVLNKVGKSGADELFEDMMKKIRIKGGTSNLYHMMASIIMAYAFDMPVDDEEEGETNEEFIEDDEFEHTILTMIPLADMLNADAHRNNARLCYETDRLEMRAIKSIAPGEEIFNDYGSLPRSDLLRRYGYITDNYAPFDVVEISSDFICSVLLQGSIPDFDIRLTVTDIERRKDLAIREDIFEDAYDISHGTPDSSCLPDELVAFIYLLLIDDGTVKSVMSSSFGLSPRSRMETELVGKVLAHILNQREHQYATSIEEDEKLLREEDCAPRLRMALQVRLGEKQIIREAIKEVSSYQGSDKRMRVECRDTLEINDGRSQKRQRFS